MSAHQRAPTPAPAVGLSPTQGFWEGAPLGDVSQDSALGPSCSVLVPLEESLAFAQLAFPLLPSQLGTRRRAESQISNENCQEISPLQKKQGKTTSWWVFPGEEKVK